MGEWQPIETAPKDGSEVLLFSPVKNVVYIGYHTKHATQPHEGWVMSQFNVDPYFTSWHPSHWMPLPPPPSSGLD